MNDEELVERCLRRLAELEQQSRLSAADHQAQRDALLRKARLAQEKGTDDDGGSAPLSEAEPHPAHVRVSQHPDSGEVAPPDCAPRPSDQGRASRVGWYVIFAQSAALCVAIVLVVSAYGGRQQAVRDMINAIAMFSPSAILDALEAGDSHLTEAGLDANQRSFASAREKGDSLRPSFADHLLNHVWNCRKRQFFGTQHDSQVMGLAATRDGKYMAAVGYNCRLHVSRLPDGKSLKVERPSGREARMKIFAVAISPDDRIVAAAFEKSNDTAYIGLWELPDAESTEVKWVKAIEAHANTVTSLAFHPKRSDILVSGSDTPTQTNTAAPTVSARANLKLWKLERNKDGQIREKRLDAKFNRDANTHRMAFDPRGEVLAVGSADGYVRIYDVTLDDGKEQLVLRTHPLELDVGVNGIMTDNRNVTRAAAEWAGQTIRYRLVSGRLTVKLEDGRVRSVSFSPWGDWRRIGEDENGSYGEMHFEIELDGTIRGSTGIIRDGVTEFTDELESRLREEVKPQEEGSRLEVKTVGGRLRAMRLRDNRNEPLRDIISVTDGSIAIRDEAVMRNDDDVRGVHVFDDYVLVAGGEAEGLNYGEVRAYDRTTLQQLPVYDRTDDEVALEMFPNICHRVYSLAVIHPKSGGCNIALGVGDGTCQLFEIERERRGLFVRFLGANLQPGAIRAVAWEATRQKIIAAGTDGRVRQLPLRELKRRLREVEVGTLVLPAGQHPGGAQTMAFSPDGKYLVVGAENSLQIWSISAPDDSVCVRTSGLVQDVRFSDDGQYLLVATWKTNKKEPSGEGAIWRFADLRSDTMKDGTLTPKLLDFHCETGGVRSIAMSPSGKFAVTGDMEHHIQLWQRNGSGIFVKCAEPRADHGHWVYGLEFINDTEFLSGSHSGDVRRWRIVQHKEGEKGYTLKELAEPLEWNLMYNMALAPDGQHLLTGCWDNTARWWDLQKRQEVAEFRMADVCTAVACSPDANTLAVGSQDGVVKIVNLSLGRVVLPFNLYAEMQSIRSLAFAPDGEALAIGGSNGLVKVLLAADKMR